MSHNPSGWQRSKDQWGRDYYVNHSSKVTQWDAPPNVIFNDEGYECAAPPSKGSMAPPSYDHAVSSNSPPSYTAHSTATVHPENQAPQRLSQHRPSAPHQASPHPPAGPPPSNHAANMLPPIQQQQHHQSPHPQPQYQQQQYQPQHQPQYQHPPQQQPQTLPHYPANNPQYQPQPPQQPHPPSPHPNPHTNAYAPRPYSHTPVIPTNCPVPANSSSVGGFFKSLANGITRMVAGTRNQPRLYPTVRQTTPIAIHEETTGLETASDSMKPPMDEYGMCSTICRLRCITISTIFIVAMIALIIVGASLHEDKGDIWQVLMVAGIVLLCLYYIPYWFVVVPSLCHTHTGRTCCSGSSDSRTCCCCRSRVSPLYLPLHRAFNTPPLEKREFTAKITAMDQATPSLWVRVEGYAHSDDYYDCLRSHDNVLEDQVFETKYDNGEPRRSRTKTRAYYGFTHYVPIAIASAANLSCDADRLFEWHAKNSKGTALTMAYTYKVTPQDEAWLVSVQNQLRQTYMGHESCHFIHTDIVYTLDGVTPPGRQASLSPYDRRHIFSRYLRPGMNAELHDWSHATVNRVPVVNNDTKVQFVRERGKIFCHDLLVNRFCAFVSLCVMMYLPYICCARMCTNETTYTHRKALRLYQELVPVPPQKPYAA